MHKHVWIAPLVIVGLGVVTFVILAIGWWLSDWASKRQRAQRSVKPRKVVWRI